MIEVPDIVRNRPNISDDPKVREEQMTALYKEAGALALAAASGVEAIVPTNVDLPDDMRKTAEKALVTVMFLGVAETIIRRAMEPLSEDEVVQVERSGVIGAFSSTVAGMAMRLVALNIAGVLSDLEAEEEANKEADGIRVMVLMHLKASRPPGATVH